MADRTWRDYLEQMPEKEFDELTADGTLELMNNVMAEEDEELAEEEAELGLPRGFWVPAEAYRFINESSAFLDARWDKVKEKRERLEAAEEAEFKALEKGIAELKERERKLSWKPYVL